MDTQSYVAGVWLRTYEAILKRFIEGQTPVDMESAIETSRKIADKVVGNVPSWIGAHVTSELASQPSIIGLDYDDTYSADPKLWREFVAFAKARGHTVTIVTARTESLDVNGEVRRAAEEMGIDVVFTGGVAKSQIFQADIWIDDSPIGIPTYDQMDASVRLARLHQIVRLKDDVQGIPLGHEIAIHVTGRAGVGKTAIIREIVLALAEHDIVAIVENDVDGVNAGMMAHNAIMQHLSLSNVQVVLKEQQALRDGIDS